MAHEIAKLLLEKADTFIKRKEAIRTALDLGMPLNEIEDYLDWLEVAPPRATEQIDESKKYRRN